MNRLGRILLQPPGLPTTGRILLQSPTLPTVAAVRTHLGYIPFEGRMTIPQTNQVKFFQQIKLANNQPVKKITYTFDPMTMNCHSLRNFMFFWNTTRVKKTNLKMISKVEIVDDRRDPTVVFNLNDGRDLEIRTANLTELEIATVVNTYLLPLVKEEEAVVVTKSEKAAAGGKKKKK